VGFLLIVIGILVSSIVLVQAGYRGILMRFGAVQGTLSEGIHIIVPTINTVAMMEVRTQKEESKATAASRDLQVVTTTLALNFRVDPNRAHKVYRDVGTEYRSRIIDPAVQESLKVVTTHYTAEDLIRLRAQVKSEVELEITNRLKAYNIIVDKSGLSIVNFDFSPEFNKAIEQKQVAQQEAEKQKYVLQQAELERQTDVARAQGKSQAAKLNADALRVQGGTLLVTREWIEKWDGHLPQVASGNNGFMIDLKSLLQQAK
jgi:regulator of protease activity HflC (stomatin/prohibitin superfamily)